MTKFRSGKRKDGSRFTYPIKKTVGDVGQKVRMTKVSIEKHNPWGRFGQRDIQRERDAIPNCNPDSDLGWLPSMERDLDREFDAKEKQNLLETMRTAKYAEDDAEAALALAKLEREYPDVYENLTGRIADMETRE